MFKQDNEKFDVQRFLKAADLVTEGDGRKKGIHPKGHPKRKAQQAAIHAEGKK